MQNNFYKAFEDKFRGSPDDIKGRLGVYKPLLNAIKEMPHQNLLAVDLGCGRGEWLELLGEQGFSATGIDLDAAMVEHCKQKSLQVEQTDALTALKNLPSESRAIVSGFHIAEHLPFDVLQQIFIEAKRVLISAGILILETPNPENILVGTQYFYLDPTHARPLPMPLLEFIAENTGYQFRKCLRLSSNSDSHHTGLLRVFTDVSPDYALVAIKAYEPGRLPLLDKVLTQESGKSLFEAAKNYDAEIANQLNELKKEMNELRNQLDRATVQQRFKNRIKSAVKKITLQTLKHR